MAVLNQTTPVEKIALPTANATIPAAAPPSGITAAPTTLTNVAATTSRAEPIRRLSHGTAPAPRIEPTAAEASRSPTSPAGACSSRTR